MPNLPRDDFARNEPVLDSGEPGIAVLVELDLSRPVVLESLSEPWADRATAGLAVSVG